ncbi:MAG TPA: hypothetical protein DEO70_12195 [Bacteroidales bacterium]|nr:hypothetical protein [Bacteroidales bacterium]
MVRPKNLYFVGGRGTAKSTDIQARRIQDVCYDLPRASFSLVADTYVNLLTNIIPAITTAWRERYGWFEFESTHMLGHYVIGEPPPSQVQWQRPYTDTREYKRTITTYLGNKIFMLSLDRGSISAGISVVHHFIDEAKFDDPRKIKKMFPTLRGDKIQFGHSHYFMGQTVTTDMPNPHNGEFDWILDLEKEMNPKQIILILQTAFVVNDIIKEYLNAEASGDGEKLRRVSANLERWTERLLKVRRGSTLFFVVSSLANIDVLTIEYLQNLLATLGWDEFKVAVLSMKATVTKGQRFYPNLGEEHFYKDGYNYEYYDRFGFKDNISQTSAGLKYVNPSLPLELGYDAGNMHCLIIGQDHGSTYYIVKDMYVLTPEWIRELADEFVRFFAPHTHKVLYLYHDRAANNYEKAKEDFAGKLKQSIEYDASGHPTGWSATLMNRKQRNITSSEEYDLMIEMMSGRNQHLPKLLIDLYECPRLRSSLQLAPMEKDSKGNIKKVKKSEKLPLLRLPMESTNPSDAFKYLMCRPKWLAIVKGRRQVTVGSVKVRG